MNNEDVLRRRLHEQLDLAITLIAERVKDVAMVDLEVSVDDAPWKATDEMWEGRQHVVNIATVPLLTGDFEIDAMSLDVAKYGEQEDSSTRYTLEVIDGALVVRGFESFTFTEGKTSITRGASGYERVEKKFLSINGKEY